MGFPTVPNFITTQGHSIAAARGTWGPAESVLVGGILPRTLKEMMFVAISRDRACRYCEAAHLACCGMLGIEPGDLEALVADVTELHPPKVASASTAWQSRRSWSSSRWRRSPSTQTPSPTRPECRRATC